MKILDTLFASLVLCLSSLPLILLILALQKEATVPENPELGPDQVRAIQQLLIDHDPRQLLASEFQEVRLSETELNALITYIKTSNATLDAINISTDLVEDGASIKLSIPVHAAGLSRYFNIDLHFVQFEDRLSLASVNAGALNIPAFLLTPLRQAVAGQIANEESFQFLQTLTDSLHFQSINPERIVILLDWQGENLEQIEDQARQVFVSAREAERLLYYHDKLVDTLAGFPAEISRITLNDLLRPLFLYANINSEGGANPVAENRAIFIVLSAYLTDLELSQLIGNEIELVTPRKLLVLIDSREDLTQHVITSAAIAASAGATMAEVLSVYKEVHDSRYRTGFSFTDIAANQAGSLLGTLASRSANDALLFQNQIQTMMTEHDYMPELGTYDGMTESEFIAQYGSRESAAYLQRLQEITRSITELPFYQAF